MALEEYRKKRDFKKSPEPAGQVAERNGRDRFFCVQKHLASHLHYDFRLEHDGVLLSWAVPKGPSLDPKTKRLAMKVEDHPLEYGEFEGVIPEGYGAGIVMLWDVGTWVPEADDVDAALKKGDLKLTLNGFKLKGSWVLVRTGGRYPGARGGGDRTWLLIKHRDEWSGDLDITEFAPKSVKSDGDFEETSSAARRGDLDIESPCQGRRHRRDVRGDHQEGGEALKAERAEIEAFEGVIDKKKPRRHEDTKFRKETQKVFVTFVLGGDVFVLNRR
jgi:bifunctional non-homologous end joining protein LigD